MFNKIALLKSLILRYCTTNQFIELFLFSPDLLNKVINLPLVVVQFEQLFL